MSVGSTPTPTANTYMKKSLIILLLLLFSILGYSQNGGQFFENNVLIVKMISYSNGQYVFSIINKQTCEARVRTKADQDPAVDVIVNAKDSILTTVLRPRGGEIVFRAKAETFCVSNPDMGWLEIKINLASLSLENSNGIILNYTKQNEILLINNVLISKFIISHTQFIYIYDIIGNKLFYQKSYIDKQSEINLFPYLKNGINFIKVIIENKIYTTYLFKVIK